VVITAGMAYFFLKRKQYRHHVASLITIICGVFLVGLSSQLYKDPSKKETTTSLGIILLLVSQLFAGTLFIVEEKLLGDYYLHPLKVVGWEGCWGCCYYAILLPIFQYIPCSGSLCPNGVLEDSALAFH